MFKKIFAAFYLITLLSVLSAQEEIGVIYSKAESDKLYGNVDYSIEYSSEQLKNELTQTNNVAMFKFIDGNIIILGDDRTELVNDAELSFDESALFYMFSKSIILELLNKGNHPITFFEMRGDVFTMTNNNYTLEYSTDCPPFCK